MAIGGGHGLAATLRAVRTYTDRVTAIVSVADDGGSSGRLRELLHIIPPGDLRKCLVALAEPGSLLASAFEYRFTEEELAGHALGNLILAGLIDATGDPVAALDEACRLLGVTGRVLPGHHRARGAQGRRRQGPGGRPGGGDGHRPHPPGVPGARRPAAPPQAPSRPWTAPTRSSSGPGRCSPACWPPWPCPASGTAISRSSAPQGLRLQPAPPGTRNGGIRRGHARGRPGRPRRRGGYGGVRYAGMAVGAIRPCRWSMSPWPGPTGWPTIRPNWRQPSSDLLG